MTAPTAKILRFPRRWIVHEDELAAGLHEISLDGLHEIDLDELHELDLGDPVPNDVPAQRPNTGHGDDQ